MILEVRQLSKRYGALVVIDCLNMTLEPGEVLGVIGPNGAGKSTLLNMIGGSVAPDAGTIIYRGQDITGLPPFARCKRGIGRSFQVPRPFAGMTVFENLLVSAAFGADGRESAAYERCADVLRQTNLLRKSNVKAGTLTLLERKRLELARALATRPHLLLLDEIAGGLSEHECRELVALLREIRDQGISIIWIEHVLHALRAIVTRLMVIGFGTKLEDGPPERVMASPQVRAVYLGIEADAAADA